MQLVAVAAALLTLVSTTVALLLTAWSYRPGSTYGGQSPMPRHRAAVSTASSDRAACAPALVDKAMAASSGGPQPENVPTPRASVVALRHPSPAVHPLLETLEGLTVRQLRTLAGIRSKRHRKAELIDLAGMALA